MKFLLLPTRKKLLFLQCLTVVLLMRAGLSLFKFDRLHRHIASFEAARDADARTLAEVAWGVSRASRFVPLASCLTQALSGQYLLARKGMRSRIRFGVERRAGPDLRAHAWLLSGDRVVLGAVRGGMGGYHRLADFG